MPIFEKLLKHNNFHPLLFNFSTLCLHILLFTESYEATSELMYRHVYIQQYGLR